MKTEAKVIWTIVLVWLAGEAVIRPLEPRLSADLRNIAAFSTFAGRIEEARQRGGSAVVVIGNSLARAGLDGVTLAEGLEGRGWPSPEVFYLAPDASGVNEWAAAWRRHLEAPGARPDLVLIATGPSHLLDQPVRSPEKLAAFHARLSDWPWILRDWLADTDERARFVLAGGSRLFANRDRLQPLVCYRFIPGYEATANRLNRGTSADPRERFQSGSTVARFGTLLADLRSAGIRPVVVAVPLPDPYELPDEIREAASREGAALFDGASSIGWPSDQFPDGYHLGRAGAVEFTHRLLKWLESSPSGTSPR